MSSEPAVRRGTLLVVDDEAAMVETLQRGLRRRGFEVHATTSPRDALAQLATLDVDVLVTDLNMKEIRGIDLCERALGARPGLPVVVLTAFGSLDTAVEAIRAGAYDFVTKPVEMDVLSLTLDRAVEHRRLREEVRLLREGKVDRSGFEELVGDSAAMRRVYDLLARVADTDVTVLVTGESGTGKELVARALHRRGGRSAGPFVAINCAALPEQLLESELFGHTRGAFTDARVARIGLLVRASGGTLFLDEIGEMPPGMQVKLLRALQERTLRPLGGTEEIGFDVRLIAATNRDLSAAVAAGTFREDLYFRLNVIEISLPPLRARGNDVLLLSQQLLERMATRQGKRVAGLSTEAARKLVAYHWPGNVRELSNVVERAVALARHDRITVDDLPPHIATYHAEVLDLPDATRFPPLEEVERRYILKVLEAVEGHRARAATILGVDRKTLYRKLERWEQGDPEPER